MCFVFLTVVVLFFALYLLCITYIVFYKYIWIGLDLELRSGKTCSDTWWQCIMIDLKQRAADFEERTRAVMMTLKGPPQ